MYSYEYSIETKASVQAIWRLYSDVTTWPSWDSGILTVELDGPFADGATGKIVLREQDTFSFRILSAVPNKGFSDETEIPGLGAVIRFIHTLGETPSGSTKVTHRVEIDGSAADTLGPAITAGIPKTMEALVDHALRIGV